ncbi:methyltransferase [Candidatus Pacearchaeota archaeon]|nr:methyltransferase [Candidatus Pacearchaeota archaeon]
MIYEPAEDSLLLAKEAAKHARGKQVIDMGTGSGIQAKAALDAGAASVVAVDINREALRHARQQGIQVKYSDLFSKVKGKFDLIIFNPPYLPEDKREDKDSRLITSGGKYGDEILLRFLKQASLHLNEHGSILIVLSSLTKRTRIIALLKKLKMKHELQARQKLFMESLEVWKIEKQ